jgi:copper homeostasis protein
VSVLLEVAVGSESDARTAERHGADRVELNAALALGGLTPSLGLVRGVREAVSVPLIVMIRPREAGFCYSDGEFAVMRRDLELALAHGADGFAFGVLTADGRVDGPRCRTLIEQSAGRVAVFHRAFDVTPDPLAALEELIDLGVRRVMTSGQQPTALAGAGLIAELIRVAKGRIEILPAGGIRPQNAAELLARTGCDQVHAGLRMPQFDRSTAARPSIRFGSGSTSEERYDATDPVAVAALRAVLDAPPSGDAGA